MRSERSRRGFLTGGRPTPSDAQLAPATYGERRANDTPHLTLEPEAVDEPTDDSVVPMQQGMSPEEASLYEAECNVVDYEGKSEVIFKEIEGHFGFIGGIEENFVKYMERPEVKPLWLRALTKTARRTRGSRW